MRDLKIIQTELDEARDKHRRLKTEVESLVRSVGGADEMTEGQLEATDRRMRGMDVLEQDIKRLGDEMREAIRSNADAGYVEHGDGAAPRTGPTVISRTNVRNPWDVRGDYPSSGGELVRHAIAACEQVQENFDHEIDRSRFIKKLESTGRLQDRDAVAQWVLVSSDPLYRSAFEKIVADPVHGLSMLDHDEIRAFRRANEVSRTALSLTSANGGYLVPFTLDPSVILTNSGVQDPIRQIATVKTIATNNWNGVTSAGVTAEWLGEGSQAADASPTFVQPTITPKKAAAWVFGSYEVLADSGFANELGTLMSDAKTRLEAAAFATGNTGASQPRGIVAAVAAVTASIVAAAATNAFAVGDVYNVSDALRPRDASQATWIANKKLFSLIRRFDTAGGGSFWANLGMGRPSELLGQPQYECSTMTGIVSTGANVLLVGNFKEYYVVDRVGMSIMYEPMVKSTGSGRPTGQAGWFAFWRVGADVVDADAFRLLQLNTVAAATALA